MLKISLIRIYELLPPEGPSHPEVEKRWNRELKIVQNSEPNYTSIYYEICKQRVLGDSQNWKKWARNLLNEHNLNEFNEQFLNYIKG